MEPSTQPTQAAAGAAVPETKERSKRKGPKPSSKKRLEKFRLDKSRETMAEIHRQAIERTSASVDALLKCLSDLQIVAQKQEVVVPITTRGVGFLVNESYEEARLQCPKAVRECTVHQVYRVAMAQLQCQYDMSDCSRSLSDPVVEQLDTQNPRMSPSLQQQALSFPQNFSLVAELVNSVGKFEHNQVAYRPEIAESGPCNIDLATPKRRRMHDVVA